MNCIIGKKAHCTDNGTQYVSNCIVKRNEGELYPVISTDTDFLWNAWFNQLFINIENNKDKTLVWRTFPEVVRASNEHEDYLTIRSRYCFE